MDTLATPVTPAGVGIYSGSNYVGFSSNIDFISGIGATIRTVFDSTVGITTVTFDSEPLRVGISTGLGAEKVFAGIATEINFIGYGISITAVQNATGIASITFDGSASGGGGGLLVYQSIPFSLTKMDSLLEMLVSPMMRLIFMSRIRLESIQVLQQQNLRSSMDQQKDFAFKTTLKIQTRLL